MKTIPGTIPQLIEYLRGNPEILGLIRYGGRKVHDSSPGGDFDLYVIVHSNPTTIESIHLYLGQTPVDLNIRTLEDLRLTEPVSFLDTVLLTGEILFDRDGVLPGLLEAAEAAWNSTDPQLSANQISWERFSQQHVIDKLEGRLHRDELFSRFLLSTNIYWLIGNYFRLRTMEYPGEGPALRYLLQREPEIYRMIESFYSTSSLDKMFELTKELTAAVLAPVGGPWRKDEVVFLPRKSEQSIAESEKSALMERLFP